MLEGDRNGIDAKEFAGEVTFELQTLREDDHYIHMHHMQDELRVFAGTAPHCYYCGSYKNVLSTSADGVPTAIVLRGAGHTVYAAAAMEK